MPLVESGHVPSSTYRVQLHKEFDFATLAGLADYFGYLGISDLYLSPIFKSVPGSQHGYDVTDFSEINPELGGSEGFGSSQPSSMKRAAESSWILFPITWASKGC